MDEPRRHFTLAARTVAITCVVALVSVLAAASIALPLATQVAQAEARRSLADRADLATIALNDRLHEQPRKRLARLMRKKKLDVYLIIDGESRLRGLPGDILDRIAMQRESVSVVRKLHGRAFMFEGRPLRDDRSGVVLAEPVPGAMSVGVLRRVAAALAVGLMAGLGAGYLLARRLSQPLRRVAHAARRMSGGERGVVIVPEPPREVAEVSRAINELSHALVASEGRQREFLMSVSHELRTPLTTIRGYAEALADGMMPAESGAEAGRTMLGEAARLDRLVADLLALARLQAQEFRVEMVVVDLVAVVDGAASAWRPRCREVGVELRTELSPGAVWAYTDPGRIRQVLDVLVENALRMVPAGAPIVLAARTEQHLALAEVRDGGPGLKEEDLAVAFEQGVLNRRYQGVRRVGSGLGLALACGLVNRLGGRIEAGHAPEGGARFTFRLPLRFQ